MPHKKQYNTTPEQKKCTVEQLPNWPLWQISLLILKKLKPAVSTTVLYFVLMSQSSQSVTDLNRMFYNALLMICWFGAIPLSCMSSPQVQSCDSLMKRSWWKLWDNIIFGRVPYGALRLVHDSSEGNLAGLMVHSCAAWSVCQFITVCCVRNLAFLSIFTRHYPLSAN